MRIVGISVVLIILSALMIVTIYAADSVAEDQFVAGMEYFNKADYEHAFSYFQISGEIKGYAPSQNMLGICYRDGVGTEQDLYEAEKYFKMSADQGYPPAQENLIALNEKRALEKTEKREAYQDAMNLFFEGKYEEAKAAFEALGDYEHSAEFVEMCEKEIRENKESATEQNLKIGDHIQVENYEQDNDQLSVSEETFAISGPVISSILLNEEKFPVITWAPLDGAISYTVFRRAWGNFVEMMTTEGTSFTDKTAETGKTYYYRVQAMSSEGIKSNYSNQKKIMMPKENKEEDLPGEEANVKIGDYTTFGSYEQDNNVTNGKEPIEWQVLDVQDGKALLISRYALDRQFYYTSSKDDITWETSSMRNWLNDTFFKEAFSLEEQRMILKVDVSTDGDSKYSAAMSHSVQDQVLLLNAAEAKKYFKSDEARQCKPTAFAEHQGASTNDGRCMWWLRSLGSVFEEAVHVRFDGFIYTGNYFGYGVYYGNVAVRPAIWVPIDSVHREILWEYSISLDYVIWNTKEQRVVSTVEENNMVADVLLPEQIYAPRLTVKNKTSNKMSPVISTVSNGKTRVVWSAREISPDKSWGFVLTDYTGAGEYRFTYYIDGYKVCDGEYSVKTDSTFASSAPMISSIQIVRGMPVVEWEALPGAASYDIYRSEDDVNYSKLRLGYNSPNRAYTCPTCKEGKQYYFKVIATAFDGTKSSFSKAESIIIPSRK